MVRPEAEQRLEPPPLFEVIQHGARHDDHETPDTHVTVPPVQLGHVVEVHAVYADHERERDEHRGNHGEDLHDLVHPVAQRGHVDVHHPGKHVTEGLYCIHDLYRMVIHIPKVWPDRLADEWGITSLEGAHHFTQRPD